MVDTVVFRGIEWLQGLQFEYWRESSQTRKLGKRSEFVENICFTHAKFEAEERHSNRNVHLLKNALPTTSAS